MMIAEFANRIKFLPEPLAVASRICQVADTRGDHVLLTLGKISKKYTDMDVLLPSIPGGFTVAPIGKSAENAGVNGTSVFTLALNSAALSFAISLSARQI